MIIIFSIWHLDGTLTGTTIMLRVGMGVMAMKGYSTFSKAPGREIHIQIQFSVIYRTLVLSGVLPLCRDAVEASANWAVYGF